MTGLGEAPFSSGILEEVKAEAHNQYLADVARNLSRVGVVARLAEHGQGLEIEDSPRVVQEHIDVAVQRVAVVRDYQGVPLIETAPVAA